MSRSARPSGSAVRLGDVRPLGLIWGISVVLQRIAVAEIAPLTMVTLRLLAALLFFLPFCMTIWRGLRVQGWLLPHVLVIGVLNPALSAIFSALALQFASSGLVAILASLAPLLAALLGQALPGKERLSRPEITGDGGCFWRCGAADRDWARRSGRGLGGRSYAATCWRWPWRWCWR